MRSIGKKNIAIVKKITREEMSRGGDECLDDRVVRKLDESLWDLWEGADAEIRRIIWDTMWGKETV